jgi:hypothetical protein
MAGSGGWLRAVAVRASYPTLKGFRTRAAKVSSAVPLGAEQISRDPRTVPRGSVDTFL